MQPAVTTSFIGEEEKDRFAPSCLVTSRVLFWRLR